MSYKLRMRFLTFITLFTLTFVSVAYANTKDDLIDLANALKTMESKKNIIEDKLIELELNRDKNFQEIYNTRYRIAQNIFSYHSLMNVPTPVINLLKNGKLSDYYFEKRHKEYIRKSLVTGLKSNVKILVDLELKIANIKKFKRQKTNLESAIQAGFDKIIHKNIDSKDNKTIDELKNKTASLNEFILKLIGTSDGLMQNNDDSISFILPVSGIINQKQQGVTINTHRNSVVVSPANGRILYAGTYKTLDGVVIIEHAQGYVSIIQGLNKIITQTGFVIHQGDPIGINFNYKNDKINEERGIGTMLYYELRYNGKTTNPIQIISGL